MDEDKILETLKVLADEDIEIPESLQPDRIKNKLAKEDEKLNTGKRRKNMKHWLMGSIAAVGAVAAAFAVMINTGYLSPDEMTGNVLTSISDIVAGKQLKKQKKTAKKVDGIKQFKDYKALYKYFAKAAERREWSYSLAPTEELAGGTNESAAADTAKSATPETGGDYSKTNTRTEGVDEADIVKTDGKYIYVLKNGYDGVPAVKIIKTDNGKMEAAFSKIGLDRSRDGVRYYYNDIMLYGNTLIVFGYGYRTDGGENELEKVAVDYRYGNFNKDITEVSFDDITNREKPVFIARHTQEGSIGNTRMKDGIIYTFSQNYTGYYYPVLEDEKKAAYDMLIPKVDGKKVKIGNIYVPEYSYGDYYTVVTSIDIKNPKKIIDTKIIMDSGGQLYVSNENIYFWNTDYTAFGEKTKLIKYSYKDGIIEPQASCDIAGRLNDDYSLDEYKGNLRLVITKAKNRFRIWPMNDIATDDMRGRDDTENALYILDKELNVTGKIEGLAKGEYIKSARFMGDMAYFVTFRQTDPLFSVDVSNPANPKILGYLKIPGFSEYLHPFGSGLLFGLGQDADEKVGGTKGLKLSMFDISNPADVKEIAKKLFSEREGDYSHSEAEFERKAILVDAKKNLIGFPVTYYSDEKRRQINQYAVYSFDKEKGFYEKFTIDFADDESYYNNAYRGVYIGDYFYMAPANMDKAFSFDLKNGKLVEELNY